MVVYLLRKKKSSINSSPVEVPYLIMNICKDFSKYKYSSKQNPIMIKENIYKDVRKYKYSLKHNHVMMKKGSF